MAHAGKCVCALILCGIVLVLNTETAEGQTYTGNIQIVLNYKSDWRWYCACYYGRWRCSAWRRRWETGYFPETICATGWTHAGDYKCNVPICLPNCLNQGRCTNPNECTCLTTSTGQYCGTLTCSYQRPCYPGDCVGGTTCVCDAKFSHVNISHGCTQFKDPNLKPFITKSVVTLSNVRRVDNWVNFMFVLDGTNKTYTDVIWINQIAFNNITFEMESVFKHPEALPKRPLYVHDAQMGITLNRIYIRISSIPRDAGNFTEDDERRDLALNKTYPCDNGLTQDNPAVEKATCTVIDDQFKTAIEHGDWMTLTFQSFSGGYQKLVDIDRQGSPYATRYYKGFDDVTKVRFKFDFRAPTHCSEPNAYNTNCPYGATILDVGNPFTKNPIQPRWLGWVDDLSGMWQYYVEVFRLDPNDKGDLTELTPINPEFSALIDHSSIINYPSYTPTKPGMYSVLMETRDLANNSRTSRRFVLYDPISNIEVSKDNDSRLYVASAVAETGYIWQTGSTNGKEVHFRLRWSGHFVNRIHKEGKLLNAILPYPIQFKDIQDDGILYSEKFVSASLDAPVRYEEGNRTRAAIPNFHGIVLFETAEVLQASDNEPSNWHSVDPLAEEATISLFLEDGDKVRLWVRATDIMGNKVTDKTIVGIDRTAPTMSDSSYGNTHSFTKNVKNASYVFSSNVKVVTSDPQSGVYRIDFKIWMTINGQEFLHSQWSEDSNSLPATDANCQQTFGDKCFIPQQSIDINNCRFMVNKTDIDQATARLEVAGVNQALLSTSTSFTVGPVNKLDGLEKYSGPTNIRTENPTASGFRVKWDLPEHPSCYGIADIVIILIKTDATGNEVQEIYSAPGTATHFDILGLEPETSYSLKFSVKGVGDSEVDFKAQTGSQTAGGGVGTGAIVGVVVGLLLACCLAVAVLFVLMRKGIIHPQERAREIRRAVTVKARTLRRRTNQHGFANAEFQARQSEMYIYGIEDVEGSKKWQLDRNDISLESLLKAGHFANIYTARMRSQKSKVVAKTLKENFTGVDATVMKAKMNFAGKKVGDHPNILKFLGGVTTDTTMGPFILYEYCEKGTLRDYLVSNQGKVTVDVQENLFRFCLEICKGMSYLASKQIVHRRLAARNILLTLTNEVKIYGFGPQPNEEDGGDAEAAKKERIPIKWMAPECMISTKDASEKSDVWSFGIVLWEIFSLGENPFENVRSKDLPSHVKRGQRPAKPEQADDTWYGVMSRCWIYEQRKRPKFADICPEIEGLFVAPSGDDNYYYQR